MTGTPGGASVRPSGSRCPRPSCRSPRPDAPVDGDARAFLAGRSMRMRDAGAFRRVLRKSRTFRVFGQHAGEVLFDAYRARPVAGDRRTKTRPDEFSVPWSSSPPVADGDEDVAGRLADAVAAAPGARGETLQRGSLLDVDRVTFSSSMSAPSLCSAFAMALSSPSSRCRQQLRA